MVALVEIVKAGVWELNNDLVGQRDPYHFALAAPQSIFRRHEVHLQSVQVNSVTYSATVCTQSNHTWHACMVRGSMIHGPTPSVDVAAEAGRPSFRTT